jgi:hypothetical protein
MNRALEFLQAAQGSFPVMFDRHTWKAKHYVGLAIAEVEELLARITELEAMTPTPTHSGGVLIVDALTPAKLSESPRPALGAQQRKALPGNGKL